MAKLENIKVRVQPVVVKPDEKLIISVPSLVSSKELQQMAEMLRNFYTTNSPYLILRGDDIDYYVLMKEAKVELEVEGQEVDGNTTKLPEVEDEEEDKGL